MRAPGRVDALLGRSVGGLGVEIGESFNNVPQLSLGTTSPSDRRFNAFATFGTLSVSLLFGD